MLGRMTPPTSCNFFVSSAVSDVGTQSLQLFAATKSFGECNGPGLKSGIRSQICRSSTNTANKQTCSMWATPCRHSEHNHYLVCHRGQVTGQLQKPSSDLIPCTYVPTTPFTSASKQLGTLLFILSVSIRALSLCCRISHFYCFILFL